MNLCVIPARGGSKRIPRKNIKIFGGKPMIAHAILTAKLSGLFEHIVVSTDDDEIAEKAVEWGAEVPFARPDSLADDYTPTVPVVAHAVSACVELGWDIDFVCCVYPCVPLLHAADLQAGLDLLKRSSADYCFPVAEFPSAIQRALKQAEDGHMSPFYPQYELSRTQDLETAFYDAGQFYWGSVSSWRKNPQIHSSGVGYRVPSWRVVDIDTPEDWHRAEVLFDSLDNGGLL